LVVSLAAWFRRDPEALTRLRRRLVVGGYPHLHLVEVDNQIEAIGTVALGAAGRELTRFALRVVLPDHYPRDLPKVYETKGRIPRTADHHVNPDGSLCVGLPESIWLEHGDLDLVGYLDGPLRSYLVGVCEVEGGRQWPFGEWSHGSKGVAEFYVEYLATSDRIAVAGLLRMACRPQIAWIASLCPCRSGVVVSRCHGDKLRALKRRVPRGTLRDRAGMFRPPALPRRLRAPGSRGGRRW
jgi:hypothetical protein